MLTRLLRLTLALTITSLSFPCLAGLPNEGDPSEYEPPTESFEGGFDEMVGRAGQSSPTYTVFLGNQDTGLITATINAATDTVTMQMAGATTQTFSFTAIAQNQYPGNALAQSHLVANLDALGNDRDLLVSFESYSFRSGVTFDDNPIVDYQCAFIPCERVINPADPAGYHWRSTLVPDWDSYAYPLPGGDGSYPGYTAEQVRYDRQRYEAQQADACDQMLGDSLEMYGTGTLAGLSCLFFETGVGALGCAGGIASTASQARDAARLERQCNRPYPGPGNW